MALCLRSRAVPLSRSNHHLTIATPVRSHHCAHLSRYKQSSLTFAAPLMHCSSPLLLFCSSRSGREVGFDHQLTRFSPSRFQDSAGVAMCDKIAFHSTWPCSATAASYRSCWSLWRCMTHCGCPQCSDSDSVAAGERLLGYSCQLFCSFGPSATLPPGLLSVALVLLHPSYQRLSWITGRHRLDLT